MRGLIDAVDAIVRLVDGWRALQRTVSFWSPSLALPAWLAPVVALAGLLGLVLLSGISLASLGSLLTAMLLAALLLEQVFGVTLQIAPPPRA